MTLGRHFPPELPRKKVAVARVDVKGSKEREEEADQCMKEESISER